MTPGKPLFSVVVPTYNRPGNLVRLLESLSGVAFPRQQFEVIVVDDGGSCPLASIGASFSDRLDITVIRQEHGGPAVARNSGGSVARGEYLVFIDDDCTVPDDWLETLAHQFSGSPAKAVTGKTVNVLGGNPFSAASQMLIDYLYGYFNAGEGSARFLTSNNLALPVSVFREIGGFDTDFKRAAGEDRDLCGRLLHGRHEIVYNPRVTVYHSHHLTLYGFVRQHFMYGRAAFLYHRRRAARSESRVAIEPLSFYAGVIAYPWSRKRSTGAMRLSVLLAITQAVNAAGMACECVMRRQLP